MRKFLAAALTSLLTGLLFSAGVLITVLAFGLWEFRPDDKHSGLESVTFPPGLVIEDGSEISGQPHYRIQGKLTNAGRQTLVDATILASILVRDTRVNECRTVVGGSLSPGESRVFVIECPGVSGATIHPDLRHELRVTHAFRGG